MAQHQAIAACRRYVRTRHVRNLFDAVRALESAVRCKQDSGASGLTPGSCAVEAERLGQALSDALSPSAFSFLADRIRDLIRTQVAEQYGNRHGRAGRMDEEQEQWLSREAWTDPSHEEPSAEGPWFVDFLQDQYQEQLELARRTEEEAGRLEPRASIWVVGAPLSSRVGTEPDRKDERTLILTPGDPRLDDGSGVEPEDRAELPADFEATIADRRSITEQEPSGCVNLAMEEAVKEELDRRAAGCGDGPTRGGSGRVPLSTLVETVTRLPGWILSAHPDKYRQIRTSASRTARFGSIRSVISSSKVGPQTLAIVQSRPGRLVATGLPSPLGSGTESRSRKSQDLLDTRLGRPWVSRTRWRFAEQPSGELEREREISSGNSSISRWSSSRAARWSGP